jgi:hypothetical protein
MYNYDFSSSTDTRLKNGNVESGQEITVTGTDSDVLINSKEQLNLSKMLEKLLGII